MCETGPSGCDSTADDPGRRAIEPQHSELADRILALARTRGADKTICPSEVARDLAGSNEKAWRLLMKPLREQAVRLADEGLVELRRKGRRIDPHDFKGIYRIAWIEKERR